MIGRPDGLLVVLDDQHRVSEVPQALERPEEPPVVAGVQPDTRLVEDVQDPHQAAADLRRQPDSLCLASSQGVGRTPERQVAQPDPGHEPEPIADFLEDRQGDVRIEMSGTRIIPQALEHVEDLFDRLVDHLRQPMICHRDRPALRTQASSLARGADTCRHVLVQLPMQRLAVRLVVLVANVLERALPLQLGISPSTTSRWSPVRSAQDALSSNPCDSARAGSVTRRRRPVGLPHGRITPSRMEILASPSSSSGFGSSRTPRPSQSGQAPYGELNENWRGSSSAMLMPHVAQA